MVDVETQIARSDTIGRGGVVGLHHDGHSLVCKSANSEDVGIHDTIIAVAAAKALGISVAIHKLSSARGARIIFRDISLSLGGFQRGLDRQVRRPAVTEEVKGGPWCANPSFDIPTMYS